MRIEKFLFGLFLAASLSAATPAGAATDQLDSEGYPYMYVAGSMTGWAREKSYMMTRNGDTYTITLPTLDGEFKVTGSEWQYNYGSKNDNEVISDAVTLTGVANGKNITASNLSDVTISFDIKGLDSGSLAPTYIRISANGHEAPEPPAPGEEGISGTLPVLYINVYNEGASDFDNEVIDRNLGHKNYFDGVYWLDTKGCKWLEDLGAKNVGSADEPLPLQIKARGNFTRLAFAKKPFKLKLGEKKSLLGMSKSKHYAILAHADDNCGYLRNFTGFNLGRRIGLPWTPQQQPVEIVINGDYRGLYFLTESIRVEKDRINITELDDNVEEASLISGGYLVELDNYDEENQIRMEEKSCSGQWCDMLRITWDTPEEYSDLQKRFVTDQFTAMNEAVGANSDELWKYMDLDDAARYYLVEEIISHVESYHGSTYLFRDHGEGQKWHFSPLWDCGNAFNGATDAFLYDCDPFGNTWIPSMRMNATFNRKVEDTWMWFMNNGYKGLIDDIDEYVETLKSAAAADRARWRSAQRPDYGSAMDVVDNTDMDSRRDKVVNHLNAKIDWLKGHFGDFTANPDAAEPERDTTPAAPLPDYARGSFDSIETVGITDFTPSTDDEYYTLQGMRVLTPRAGEIYIVVSGDKARKVIF